jgi:hypothetical protein
MSRQVGKPADSGIAPNDGLLQEAHRYAQRLREASTIRFLRERQLLTHPCRMLGS